MLCLSRLFLVFSAIFNSCNAFPENILPVKVGVHTASPYNAFSSSSNTLHVEEDFQSMGLSSYVDSMTETRNFISKISSAFFDAVECNRAKVAKLGVSFALSYSIVSQINGSISLSIAWYMASKQTGLSPLAPGQWKSLLAAYGGLYMFLTLVRPVRVAAAIAMSKTTEQWLQQTQERLDCSRSLAIAIQYLMWVPVWLGFMIGGVGLASTCSGVPVW